MILTVTLNAALDLTYDVDRLRPDTTHRVRRVHRRAGGKGLNVARALAALDCPSVATGLLGGPTGAAIRAELTRTEHITACFTELAGDSRRTVTIMPADRSEATVFNEPGPTVSEPEWRAFIGRYAELAAQADVVVLAGSLPPGVPDDAYALLLANAGTARTVLDSSGPAFLHGLAGKPDVVKPNSAELRAATGYTDPVAGAAALRERGAGAVVASLGRRGVIAVTEAGRWRATAPHPVSGNPTGAGDACVAALSIALRDGIGWPETLGEVVALGGAAAAAPVAGEIDLDTYRRLRAVVTVAELPC